MFSHILALLFHSISAPARRKKKSRETVSVSLIYYNNKLKFGIVYYARLGLSYLPDL